MASELRKRNVGGGGVGGKSGGGESNDDGDNTANGGTTTTKGAAAAGTNEALQLVDDINEAPTILKPLILLYRKTPSLLIVPYFQYDITFTLVSYAFLHIVRVLSSPLVVDVWGWPSGHKDTSSTIGTCVSLAHCFILLPGLWICLTTQPFRPSLLMVDSPKWWQDTCNALIQYCMGYMVCDTVFTFLVVNYQPGVGIVLSFSDYLFLGHHFATFTYMLSCLINGSGHVSAMSLMFDGEVTNPFFNAFIITTNGLKHNCCGATPAILEWVGIIYAIQYIIARLVVGPPLGFYITYDILFTKEGRKNVHWALAIYWLLMMWGVMLGSKGWIDQSILMARTFLTGGSIGDLGIDITATHD